MTRLVKLCASSIAIWSLVVTANADDIYFTATGQEDGLPLVFRSLKSVPEGINQADFPNLISIIWQYNADENNGMPNADENDAQIEFEDALQHLDLNKISRLMLVVTGNGRKEWHWYVRDAEGWMETLNQALVGQRPYPIEITHTLEPDWSLYRNFVANVNGL